MTVDTERSWSWPKLRGVVVVAGVRSVDGTIHHIRVSRSRLIDLMADGFPISVPRRRSSVLAAASDHVRTVGPAGRSNHCVNGTAELANTHRHKIHTGISCHANPGCCADRSYLLSFDRRVVAAKLRLSVVIHCGTF